MSNASHEATYALLAYRMDRMKASHPVEYQKAVEGLTEPPTTCWLHPKRPEYSNGMCEYCYDNYLEAKREK